VFCLAIVVQKSLLFMLWIRNIAVQQVTVINLNISRHCCRNRRFRGHEYALSWVGSFVSFISSFSSLSVLAPVL